MANSAQVVVGYQGTHGSFSEAAVHEYCKRVPVKAMADRPFKPFPYKSFRETILAFYSRHNGLSAKPNLPDELLLPISNCNSRAVTDMQKELYGLEGWIAGEHFLLVEQCFLVNEGVKKEDVTEIWSMKPAVDQVTDFINKRKIKKISYKDDTSAAAEELKKTKRRDVAAIASPRAGTIHGLVNLGNVCNNIYNYTHFLHIVHQSQIDRLIPRTDTNETCITKIVIHGDLYPRSGTSPFQIFVNNGVVAHEPIDADSGTFDHRTMIIDLEGHQGAPHLRSLFRELKAKGFAARVKGCYPRHHIPHHSEPVPTKIPVLTP